MKKLISAIIATAAIGLLSSGVSAQTVRIGTEGAYPPFNSIDSSGNLIGFDIDIADALCEAAKIQCEFVVQDWDGMIPGLLAKKYDAIIASMSITEERKKKVDFTDKYYNTPAKFVARKGSGIEISKAGLKGKSIAVQRSTVSENFARDNFGDVADIRAYGTMDEVYLDLASGRVDTGLNDSVSLLEGFLKTPEGKDFEFIGPGFTDPKWFGTGIGIAVRKGDDDLREKLNAAIDTIRANGTYAKINAKYFDFDVFGD